jgi:hypothetical protein
MTWQQLVLLTTYAVGMTFGQALFKVVAGRSDFGSAKTALTLLYDPLFISAIGLYAGLSVFWVWLLTFTPLSRAYLFIALALVLTAGLPWSRSMSL